MILQKIITQFNYSGYNKKTNTFQKIKTLQKTDTLQKGVKHIYTNFNLQMGTLFMALHYLNKIDNNNNNKNIKLIDYIFVSIIVASKQLLDYPFKIKIMCNKIHFDYDYYCIKELQFLNLINWETYIY